MLRSFAILAALGCLALPGQAAEEKDVTNSIGMKLVRIPVGEFTMGSGAQPPTSRKEWDERDADEAPAHTVKITRPFLMGSTEVTNAQYEQFDPEHKKLRGKFGITAADDEPVTFVTWQQAVDFCAWLSKKEGKPYRLPTEAEWEYSCRAGTTKPFSTGETLTAEQANFGVAADGKTRRGAMKVGSFKPNAWGLHDMHGNVAEWCHDWHGPYEADAQSDPVGRADGLARAVRGWSTLKPSANPLRYLRSANRAGLLPEDANRYTGFRVVLGEMPATKPLPAVPPAVFQRNVKQEPAPKEGHDPSKPYFRDFAREKKQPTIPPNTWGPIFSHWNHFTTICACPNGDVLFVWYSTVQEEGRECSQAASRLRAGSDAWEPASVFFHVPDVNAHAPVLLSDGKRLYHFLTQSFAGWDDAADCMRVSDDNGATWSRPRIILSREDPRRMSQPCSAFVAKDGKLVLAVDGDFGHRDTRVMTSSDAGKTWKVAAGDLRKAAGKYAIHPAAVQRDDGTYLAFLRGPDPMAVFASKDDGESWEAVATPFPGISVGQKAAALKLKSGALLVCSFDSKKKLVAGGGVFAALSLDDGKTWPHIRKLDNMRGYMGLTQSANGVIYLSGSQPINVLAFNEAWLKEGKAIGKE
jgi:formylglycine-generating enzyme required for sulfatase activity